MPIGGSHVESPKKKRSQKKRSDKQKSKSKQRSTNGSQISKSSRNSLNPNRLDSNPLTPENFSSLRWDNVLTDPKLEKDRIDQYKELRRQRYMEAQQQAIRTLTEQMKITKIDVSVKETII